MKSFEIFKNILFLKTKFFKINSHDKRNGELIWESLVLRSFDNLEDNYKNNLYVSHVQG